MMKKLSMILAFFLLPMMLFGIVYMGMRIFGENLTATPPTTQSGENEVPAPSNSPTEPPPQRMLSPKEPVTNCGNEICEKAEREAVLCPEDC